MQTRLLLGILCCSLALTACARQKKTGAKETTKTAGVTTASGPVAAEPMPAAAITAMTMRRGACYGRCPMYEVHISADGQVRYVGEMFTEYLGTYEKNIGAAKVAALFNQFNAYRVDTCKSDYDVPVQDLPSLTYSFTRGSSKQQISNANFGPRYLLRLADSVDALVRVDKTWKKTAESKTH